MASRKQESRSISVRFGSGLPRGTSDGVSEQPRWRLFMYLNSACKPDSDLARGEKPEATSPSREKNSLVLRS